jgi:hypothetical protein
MGMLYDVKSIHLSASGVAVPYRTRLKSAVVSANATAAARNAVFANNAPQTGTYSIVSTTMTVTMPNTLVAGNRVWLDFTSGGGVDNVYTVLTANATSFTVTTAASGTGNVTGYLAVLMEVDSYNPTAYSVIIPGEGILADNGIYVGLPTSITVTVFYG